MFCWEIEEKQQRCTPLDLFTADTEFCISASPSLKLYLSPQLPISMTWQTVQVIDSQYHQAGSPSGVLEYIKEGRGDLRTGKQHLIGQPQNTESCYKDAWYASLR